MVYVKKVLLVFLILMLVNTTPVFCTAIDSIQVDDAIRTTLGAGPDDTVVRIYCGSYTQGFADNIPLNTLLESPYTHEIRYLVDDSTETVLKYFEDEQLLEKESGIYAHYLDVLSRTEEILGVLGADVVANQIICLYGYSPFRSIYVYYQTNIGDFVYYHEYSTNGAEYLFPAVVFTSVEQHITDVLEATRLMVGQAGIDSIVEEYPVSQFDIAQYSFELDDLNGDAASAKWSFVYVLIGLAGISGGLWLWMRRKATD